MTKHTSLPILILVTFVLQMEISSCDSAPRPGEEIVKRDLDLTFGRNFKETLSEENNLTGAYRISEIVIGRSSVDESGNIAVSVTFVSHEAYCGESSLGFKPTKRKALLGYKKDGDNWKLEEYKETSAKLVHRSTSLFAEFEADCERNIQEHQKRAIQEKLDSLGKQ